MDDSQVWLLKVLLVKFHTFSEGLNGLRNEVKQIREETNNRFDILEFQNRQEHMQLMQMINEFDHEVLTTSVRLPFNLNLRILTDFLRFRT